MIQKTITLEQARNKTAKSDLLTKKYSNLIEAFRQKQKVLEAKLDAQKTVIYNKLQRAERRNYRTLIEYMEKFGATRGGETEDGFMAIKVNGKWHTLKYPDTNGTRAEEPILVEVVE